MSIYLTAILTAKPGKSELFKTFLKQLETESNKEEACLKYELHQSTQDEHVFIFHEIWANQQGLDLHNEQPHILKFREQVADIIAGPAVLYHTAKVD